MVNDQNSEIAWNLIVVETESYFIENVKVDFAKKINSYPKMTYKNQSIISYL